MGLNIKRKRHCLLKLEKRIDAVDADTGTCRSGKDCVCPCLNTSTFSFFSEVITGPLSFRGMSCIWLEA